MNPQRFEFEVRHGPNISFQAESDPRERGFGPVNSDRYACSGVGRPPFVTSLVMAHLSAFASFSRDQDRRASSFKH